MEYNKKLLTKQKLTRCKKVLKNMLTIQKPIYSLSVNQMCLYKNPYKGHSNFNATYHSPYLVLSCCFVNAAVCLLCQRCRNPEHVLWPGIKCSGSEWRTLSRSLAKQQLLACEPLTPEPPEPIESQGSANCFPDGRRNLLL